MEKPETFLATFLKRLSFEGLCPPKYPSKYWAHETKSLYYDNFFTKCIKKNIKPYDLSI
jgi:hypothetical protein